LTCGDLAEFCVGLMMVAPDGLCHCMTVREKCIAMCDTCWDLVS
jgi:hypothetical protein